MASNIDDLSGADISKVTDIISAQNSLRFCVEYLGIDGNEYRTIEYDSKHNHHDTLYECIKRWKNKTEAEGKHPKDELIQILTRTRLEHGWFPYNAMEFLTEGMGQIPASSKILFSLSHIQSPPKESIHLRLRQVLKIQGN